MPKGGQPRGPQLLSAEDEPTDKKVKADKEVKPEKVSKSTKNPKDTK